MNNRRYAVIMAGGSGERFFPLSRIHRPKQLLSILGDGMSLLEQTIHRIQRIMPSEHIFILTSELLQPTIIECTSDTIPPVNVIAEPAKRNTAGCLTLASAMFRIRGITNAVVAALPSDAYIGNENIFLQQLSVAMEYASIHPAIVTLGIPPTYPSTGYGYIELGEQLEENLYTSKRFCEKPDRTTAEQFVSSGNFLWNSGIFIYNQNFFEHQLFTYARDYAIALDNLTDSLSKSDERRFRESFVHLPSLSIDYALMEHTPHIVVMRASFQWDDLGSWDALMRICTHDEHGNVALGQCAVIDTKSSILANYTENKVLVCSLGIHEVVVVVTDDVVLVCSLQDVQGVRQVVEYLRSNGMESWL